MIYVSSVQLSILTIHKFANSFSERVKERWKIFPFTFEILASSSIRTYVYNLVFFSSFSIQLYLSNVNEYFKFKGNMNRNGYWYAGHFLKIFQTCFVC